MAELFAPLVAALASLYALRRITALMMPEATAATEWALTTLLRWCKGLHRWVLNELWRKPSQCWGVGMTLLLWSVCFVGLLTIRAAFTLDLLALPAIIVLWVLLYLIWALCRWWRNRRYRVRVLPRRRRWR